MLDATEAISHVDISRRDDVEHALRALFVSRHEDLPIFARAFNEFWRADWGGAGPAPEAARPSEEGTPPPAPLNAALKRTFAAERHLIGRVPLPPGLSLFAVASAT